MVVVWRRFGRDDGTLARLGGLAGGGRRASAGALYRARGIVIHRRLTSPQLLQLLLLLLHGAQLRHSHPQHLRRHHLLLHQRNKRQRYSS